MVKASLRKKKSDVRPDTRCRKYATMGQTSSDSGLQDLLKATLPPTPLAFSGSCPCLETVDVDSNTSDADVINSAMRFCLESTILYIPIILMVRADLSKGSVEPSE